MPINFTVAGSEGNAWVDRYRNDRYESLDFVRHTQLPELFQFQGFLDDPYEMFMYALKLQKHRPEPPLWVLIGGGSDVR